MKVKEIYNKVFKLVKKNDLESSYVHKGKRSIVQNFRIEYRFNDPERIKVRIGNDSLVSGNYIFETRGGLISIGDRTFIGGGQFICVNGISIGNDVLVSWGCTLMDTDAHSLAFELRKNDVSDWKRGIEENCVGKYKNWENVKSLPITIKDKAWIGFNSIILKGVTIGEGAIIGAGSVVRENVPDYCVVIGNPAQVVKRLK